MIQPIIIAGGVGSRLWPLSRELYPKQFLSLINSDSLLVNTVRRLKKIQHKEPIFICNNEHRFLVAEQLKSSNIGSSGIILEPMGKNTAPAITLASLYCQNESSDTTDDPILLILPSDHYIQNEEVFIQAVNKGVTIAESGMLATFGIVPSHPETGYGYIQIGENLKDGIYKASAFKEKPTKQKASEYLSSGEYLWNSGMFMFKASTYLKELNKFRPDIYQACFDSMLSSHKDLDFVRVDTNKFKDCPAESIDYAVMEKTDKTVVISLDAGWSDVGSWSSLWDVSTKDSNGNVFHGDVISSSTYNSYIYSDSALIATLGVKDLVIVQTKDALLIAERNQVQDVKEIVDIIKQNGRPEYHSHREIFRPWGKYDSIDTGNRYQVKHITVKPGESISLQMHYHRAEHWIVVSGTAKVTIGDESNIVGENESVYIPLGVKHILENPGKIPLDIIEVRSGQYLEEDDIVRFTDLDGRR